MATPVPTLVGKIAETGSDGSIAVPNTTPPTTGDYLVAFIGAYQSGGSRSVNTPSGWTLRNSQSGDTHCVAMFTKTAEAADESAGSFTFTVSDFCDVFTGAIIKLSNIATGSEIGGSEIDSGTTSFTYTTDVAATTPDSLVLAFYSASQNNNLLNTTSSYTSTPSLTWTEIVDEPAKNSTVSMSFAIASAPNTGTASITSRGATLSVASNRTRGIIGVFNGLANATGTNALFQPSPVAFATLTNSTLATDAGFHESAPEIMIQSGTGTSPTQWTNESSATTEWTNEI